MNFDKPVENKIRRTTVEITPEAANKFIGDVAEKGNMEKAESVVENTNPDNVIVQHGSSEAIDKANAINAAAEVARLTQKISECSKWEEVVGVLSEIEGVQTSIGYQNAQELKTNFIDFVTKGGESNIVTSKLGLRTTAEKFRVQRVTAEAKAGALNKEMDAQPKSPVVKNVSKIEAYDDPNPVKYKVKPKGLFEKAKGWFGRAA